MEVATPARALAGRGFCDIVLTATSHLSSERCIGRGPPVPPDADAEAGLYPIPHRRFPVRDMLVMECACARRGIASPSAVHIGALETERNHDCVGRRLTAGQETLRAPHHQLM